EELCAVLGASAGSEALVPFLQICDFVMLSRASHGTHELVEACRQGHFHLRLGERIGQRGRLLQGLAHAQTARHRQAVLFMLTWLIIPLVALPVVHALGGKPASSSQSGSEDPLSAAVLAGVSLALAAAAPRRLWAPIMMGQDRLPLNRIFGQLHDAAALRALPQRSGSDGRGACKLRAWAELRRVLVEERGLVTWAELRRALMEERGLVLVFRAVWIWTTVVFLVLPAVAPLDSMAVAAVISFSCPALILTSVFIMALAMSPRQQNEATSWLEIGQHMSRVWQFFFCLGSVCFGCLAQTQFWVIFFLASGFGPAVLLRHSCPAAANQMLACTAGCLVVTALSLSRPEAALFFFLATQSDMWAQIIHATDWNAWRVESGKCPPRTWLWCNVLLGACLLLCTIFEQFMSRRSRSGKKTRSCCGSQD
ncbi:unnamed protein product, partial [Polarella glacialis]